MESEYRITRLDRDTAERYLDELCALANQIPMVEYTAADILAESKKDRKLLHKWEHSFIALSDDKPIGFIMGYERIGEGNEQYPGDTIYISELAVSKPHRQKGVAKSLLRHFIEKNNQTGFLSLSGDINYSVQTNSAEWNVHVIALYERFGFTQRAHKDYPNRTDTILGYSPELS